MDVQLYVYDLTRGMARNMSRQLLGIQIDAVYHTAIVFGGIEYFFGAGVQTTYAGQTHHGRPMEIISLGKCDLPQDVIMEYLESLKTIYTHESYDLFAHNCNNFSNDFATFLVGRGIPDHITNLPQQVLNTPFGQMLKPQLDASMRQVTQAPVPAASRPPTMPASPATMSAPTPSKSQRFGKVLSLTSQDVLEKHVITTKDTLITIFFTSATCPPCKIMYPVFDQLAEEYSDSLFIKIDLDQAQAIAQKWRVSATPTFTTIARGTPVETWSGADARMLKTNVETAYRKAFPPHPHTLVEAPKLQYGSLKPTTYAKIPPLEKLLAKLGSNASDASIVALKTFVEKRQKDPKDATLPELGRIGEQYRSLLTRLPVEVRFAAVDLLRCAMVDARVSGYYAEEINQQTIAAVLDMVCELTDCPHNLRLVTIHLICNCFSSPLFVREMLKPSSRISSKITQLITVSLLDNSHSTTRVAAASLAFNLAATNYRVRREDKREDLGEGLQVELAASLLECIPAEDNDEALKGLLLSLGYLLYFAPEDGELLDLCKALDAKTILSHLKQHSAIANEIGRLV